MYSIDTIFEMNLKSWLYGLYISKRRSIKLKELRSSFVYGSEFCNSELYRSREDAISQLKINNTTGDKTKIRFGDYCNVQFRITLNNKGSIFVGDYVFMNYVTMRIDHNLKIGSYCLFGPNVTIWDTSNHPLNPEERKLQAIELAKDFPLSRSYESNGGSITIGDNVWIGMGALILGGVNIGEGAVVSAKSVVTNDVPPRTLVGGVPARVIKEL